MVPPTKAKTVAEIRVYEFNFSAQPEIVNGGVITAVSSLTTAQTGLTIGTPSIDVTGKKVQVQLSAGTLGTKYLLKCIVQLDAGPKRLEMAGVLSIVEFVVPVT